MPVPGARSCVAALLALTVTAAVLAGCTTTTRGTGSAVPGPATPAPPSSGGSTAVNPGGPISPISPAPNTSGARPSSCPAATCHLRLSASMASPYGIAVWADDASHSVIVVLTSGGAVVSSHVVGFESPAQLSCANQGPRSNCVLVDLAGAHAATARVLRENAGTLAIGPAVTAITPTMQARDLNQDGWIDVAGLQNDETPSYAAGQVYWQTWLSDGTQWQSTGCGARSHDAGAAPSAPLTGSCP